MIEFEVNGVQYRAGQMDARRQFHVMRRLLPLVKEVPQLVNPQADPLASLGPLLASLGSMADAEFDYVIDACLSVVQRQDHSTATWAPIVASNGMIVYDDIKDDLGALTQIMIPVIKGNLEGFFRGLPKDLLAKVGGGESQPS